MFICFFFFIYQCVFCCISANNAFSVMPNCLKDQLMLAVGDKSYIYEVFFLFFSRIHRAKQSSVLII